MAAPSVATLVCGKGPRRGFILPKKGDNYKRRNRMRKREAAHRLVGRRRVSFAKGIREAVARVDDPQHALVICPF